MAKNQIKKMNKINRKKRERTVEKSRKIIFAIGLTAIVLVVATYAWFIGITTVTVNPFEVNIISTEGLKISLDGHNWETELHVTKGIIEGTEQMYVAGVNTAGKYLIASSDDPDGYHGEYPTDSGNVNHWATAGNSSNDENQKGLEPVSTVGSLLTAAGDNNSQVQFFSKSTLTSETGGYKILAGDITSKNATGYVAFDVFLKNGAGTTYEATYNKDNDEALFLTGASKVDYQTAGDVEGRGIENSVRVGFFSLARTSASNSSIAQIQGMKCDSVSDATPLCNLGYPEGVTSGPDTTLRGYTWNIWEPNDTVHTADSVTRFNNSCIKRYNEADTENNIEIGDYATSNNACTPIANPSDPSDPLQLSNGKYISTYAINSAITTSETRPYNIYDGLNGYMQSTKMTNMDNLVLTDTANSVEETRSPLLYIAPASITKIRIYIWLEGQDVDNFDITTNYTPFQIKFGFTKDRFEATEEESGESSSPSAEANPSEEPSPSEGE